jgi:PAS domain S-box-containing protein
MYVLDRRMNQPPRILHLEDDPDYSDLVRSLLAEQGIRAELVTVDNRPDFEAALASGQYDLILADYQLPGFTGLQALEAARQRCPTTPFLLVSGTIGEQAAVESLKAGATDYVLKHWPERLGPAIRRAIQEVEDRVQRCRIETELIQRKKEVDESEKQYRLIFDGNPTPMWVFDHQTLAFLEVNDAAIQHYGFSREEFLRMTIEDIRPASEVPSMLEYLHKLLAEGTSSKMGFAGVWCHRRKDGSLIDVEIKWSPISFKGRPASLTMANDITERRRIEHRDAALSKLGQNLSAATSPADAANTIRAAAGDLFNWDAFTLDLYSDELDRIYPILTVDTDDEGRRFEIPLDALGEAPSPMARRIINQGAELILREEPIRMPSDTIPIGNTKRPSASLMLAPIRNGTKVIGILSIQSYTPRAYTRQQLSTLQTLADHCGGALERLRAEQALHESDRFFHAVWENSIEGMRLTDEAGTIVAVNEAFCKLVGLARHELEGRPFTVIFGDSVDPAKLLEGYCLQFARRDSDPPIERRIKLRNGNVVSFEETSSFVELSGQAPLLLGLCRDVTAQKRLEDQLRQSQKMEAIGQLAGGVAHDFNNILTVIHGHATLLLEGGQMPQTAQGSTRQIVQAAERAASLTRQLLTFSRRQVMQPRRLDLNEVLCNVSGMLGRILGEDIALKLDYSSQPAPVQADAGMLEQVLLNLAVNARDAMPKGGRLVLGITLVQLKDRRLAHASEAREGRFACLTVADTGCGIPPENVRRIFEPFFTTKEVGKGTGLGLATVYGIVKQHQGWVEVESPPGQGATFKVFLPVWDHPPEPVPEISAKPEVRDGTETILVVEDEEAVRELVCHFLTNHGYSILQAQSGAQALQVWKEHHQRIDLLLTDVVMPDRINGRELAEKLWAERPKLKVIFSSGYSAEVIGKDFLRRRGINYLQKPYPPQELARVVRDCLDAAN